jgi:lipopolysaccharide/colanic/teichoic acid biosynthesis glycosyltransferase
MVRDAEARRPEVVHLNVVNGPAFKHPNDPRVTPIGRWLRAASIDELPQAINVLRGEMSLVGPRPLPVIENQYDGDQALRLAVKPGLTCIWQISGRSNVQFDQWMEMDVEYVRTRSLAKDIELIARTVPAVFSVRGAA